MNLKEEIERVLDPPASMDHAEHPRAAVIALLSQVDGLAALLIKRRERPGDPWSGHVAFPGGFVSPSDEGSLTAALRELREEVGVELRREDVVGMLSPARPLNRPEVEVLPYVAYLEQPPRLSLGSEVEAARWASLKGLSTTRVKVSLKGEVVEVEGFLVDEWVVWGLTARLLKELLTRLEPLL